MEPAARKMEIALAEVEIARPAVPLVANVLAREVREANEIRALLVEAGHPTGCAGAKASNGWPEQGVDEFWEIGGRQGAVGHDPPDREGCRDPGDRGAGGMSWPRPRA